MARPKTYLNDEDRLAAIRRNKAAYRKRHSEELREYDAKRQRDKRAKRAIAEGREPGRSGNWTKFTKGELRQKRREWVEKNRDVVRLHVRLRSARKKALKRGISGRVSRVDIEFLWNIQKGRCAFCLKPLVKFAFHVDHYVPLAKGGAHERSNLRLLHKKCNLSKGARDPAEHALRNGLLCW